LIIVKILIIDIIVPIIYRRSSTEQILYSIISSVAILLTSTVATIKHR